MTFILLYLLPITFAILMLYLGRNRVQDFAQALGQMLSRERELPPQEEELSLTEALGMAHIDPRRRNVLKLFALGTGAFVLGKIIGPSIKFLPEDLSFGKDTLFHNFRVIENGDELGFYDLLGNEILVLEKDNKDTM